MARLARSNSTKSKSKEFGKPHNEKTWREKRINRKTSRDRKHKADRSHTTSSVTSKLRHQHDLRTHVLAEKNDWEDDPDYYMSIQWEHARQSADAFVSLIREVLGDIDGAFYGQEFSRLTHKSYHCRRLDRTVAEFRMVVPNTTPRSSREVWITHNTRWRRNAYHQQNSQSIRLFRSGSNSLGTRTLTEFLDAVLNEIVADVFELSLPMALVAIISSFCNASTSKFEYGEECTLTISFGDFADDREEPEYHTQISFDDWNNMAVDAFGLWLLCEPFGSCAQEQDQHVQTIIRFAKRAAASWDQPASRMVVSPFEPLWSAPFLHNYVVA